MVIQQGEQFLTWSGGRIAQRFWSPNKEHRMQQWDTDDYFGIEPFPKIPRFFDHARDMMLHS